ncbi:MAG: SAP domain-containing protein [Planctomycetes bacterium]|nr:SAP domain-containing protein [Planctomycetota bacterium]
MDIERIRRKAKSLGISVASKTKMELIRKIQSIEGNFDCFGKNKKSCDELKCSWRDECLPRSEANREK